jgi:hypothetical protein
MADSLDEFISELEALGLCSRKESLPVEARRLVAESSGLFERIVRYMQNTKAEMDPFFGAERPSQGWAYGAFRDAQRVIDLTVDAFCASCGLHVPRNRSTGVRKSIAVFLLESSSMKETGAIGEIHNGPRIGSEVQSTRKGRHAIRGSADTYFDSEDLIWLRRRVKYPGTDIQHDELSIEIEKALGLARRIHASFLSLLEDR